MFTDIKFTRIAILEKMGSGLYTKIVEEDELFGPSSNVAWKRRKYYVVQKMKSIRQSFWKFSWAQSESQINR